VNAPPPSHTHTHVNKRQEKAELVFQRNSFLAPCASSHPRFARVQCLETRQWDQRKERNPVFGRMGQTERRIALLTSVDETYDDSEHGGGARKRGLSDAEVERMMAKGKNEKVEEMQSQVSYAASGARRIEERKAKRGECDARITTGTHHSESPF